MNRRVSTRVLEDAGDVIRDVNLADVSASEALAASEHSPTTPVQWRPAAFPGGHLYEFRVKTRQRQDGVVVHQLETMLGRLSRIFPPSVLATAHSISRHVLGTTTDTVTLATAVEFTLREWQEQLPWLTWATIPTLRVQTSTGWITPRIEALAIRQEAGRERSARAILDDLLNLFTGYVLRINPAGQLVIVPPPTSSIAVTLQPSKIISVAPATTFDDVVNRATVRSQQWEYQASPLSENVTTSVSADYQPAIDGVTGSGQRTGFQHLGTYVGGASSLPLERVPTSPGALPGFRWYADVRYDLSGRRWDEEIGWETYTARNVDVARFQEIVVREMSEAGTTQLFVEPLAKPIASGAQLHVPGHSTPMTLTSNASRGSTSIVVNNISEDVPRGTIIPHSLFSQGTAVAGSVVVPILTGGGPTASLNVGFSALGFNVLWFDLRLTGPPHPDFPEIEHTYQVGVRAAVTIRGWNWTQGRTSIEATFGDATNPEHVSAEPGFVTSQNEFGVLSRTLNAGYLNLDTDDALSIAQAYVRANMRAKDRVDLEITPDLPIRPEHINRRVQLQHSGQVVTVESWERTEMFDNTSAAVTTRVTGVVND